ncbi:ankyrin repeat domain-containing protein [Xanthomarina spongicola]|uniref:Uncharacterized protein n=1 Tax=Xanthomarina spongicola TaxID=570520 RepID=A0A316DIC2_9FLAO|nr:ankyrin repeat domain-containing protein [Xanthomarina spongicola]PWK17904.1 hypothetical protein LX78_02302 [Xanthomarina spongicola]
MNRKLVLLIGCFLATVFVFAQDNIFDVARSGTVEEIKQLMSINPDTINVINDRGFFPLTLSCYNGNEAVGLFLINHVKNINGDSKYGTPLMAAVFKGQVTLSQALLEKGANPNIADVNKTTPLHYAVLLNNESLIYLLMDFNADATLKDSRGKTALDYALMDNNKKIIELLENK